MCDYRVSGLLKCKRMYDMIYHGRYLKNEICIFGGYASATTKCY